MVDYFNLDLRPYAELNEEERKAKFGYGFKRNIPGLNAYVVTVEVERYGFGYGVVSKEEDPWGKYDVDEVAKYLQDYPEMNVKGWLKPYDEDQLRLIDIRTKWVNWEDSAIKSYLYTNCTYKFVNDDIWENYDKTRPLIEVDSKTKTCDEVSTLIGQYTGDNDEKASQLIKLRNEGKNYIRAVVEKFLAEHASSPEEPVFEQEYIQ